jgi:arylsulfatase A-like enzyme
VVLAVLASGLLGCARRRAAPPPNILLISIDSLRADHVHCYGYPKETSPNLDRLAREGARFETVIAESSWTIPSHGTLFTGVGSRVHGLETGYTRLAPQRRTLAQMLKQAGYRTAGVFSGPYLHPVFGFAAGFDTYGSVIPGGPAKAVPGGANIVEQLMENTGAAYEAPTSQDVSEKALEFLEKAGAQPFFLFLHYFDVHYDYDPPEAYWRRFDPDYHGQFTGRNFIFNRAVEADMNPRDFTHLLARYDGEILYTDFHIGRVIEALDRNGLGGRTLVLVTSDHGDEFFEHGDRGHRHSLWEEVVRVPLIARLPGRIPAGARIGGLARHLDVTPTVLSYAGLSEPLPGADLRPSLETGKPAPAAYAASRLIRKRVAWSSVRTADSKYVLLREGDLRTEFLFDLRADPGETDAVAVVKTRAGSNHPDLSPPRMLLGRWDQMGRPDPVVSLGGEGQMAPELLEQLRSLGYVQ